MRAPTSPTAISMSCCWPRSIARCSGSVRSRGGTWSGWRNLPKSSATQGRSKFSMTGCLTPRFCSISCSTAGRRRRGWKWRGHARYAPASSAFSPQPRRLRSWAGGSGSGRWRPSCRSSSFLPAASPTARDRYRRLAIDRAEDRDGRAQAAARLLLFIGSDIDLRAFSGKATISSGSSAGSESSDWPRRAMEPIPTRLRPARSPWPSAMTDSRPN